MKFSFSAAAMAIAWSLAFVLVGCIDTRTMPVDNGPVANAADIQAALDKPLANMKATDIKVGESVILETTQDIAIGQNISIAGETGATIESKTEDNDRVVYSGTLKQMNLQTDGEYAKVFREGQILCASKTPCACGECVAPTDGQSATKSITGVKKEPIVPQTQGRNVNIQSLPGYKDPAQLVTTAVAAAAPAMTYHSFSTWVSKERPPDLAASQPNCQGIPSCLIDVYHVNFDIVYWDQNPKGDRIHVEKTMSPSVPYLSGDMSICTTQLVKVGTDGSSVLLKQCSDVIDFRYGYN